MNEIRRAADALANAYGIELALEKARLIEVDSVVPDFARQVREELEARIAQKARPRVC